MHASATVRVTKGDGESMQQAVDGESLEEVCRRAQAWRCGGSYL